MSKISKTLQRMENNPRDWRIEDLISIAERHNVIYRQPHGSHVVFRTSDGRKLSVPARKPIKPVYVQQFLALIKELIGEGEDD